jgi:hypothetical protein
MIAVELARVLEQAIPHVKARATSLGGFVVVASYWREGHAHPIVIKDTTEFGLLMAFLEQKAEQAGRPLAPLGRMIEDGRAKETVYQH